MLTTQMFINKCKFHGSRRKTKISQQIKKPVNHFEKLACIKTRKVSTLSWENWHTLKLSSPHRCDPITQKSNPPLLPKQTPQQCFLVFIFKVDLDYNHLINSVM